MNLSLSSLTFQDSNHHQTIQLSIRYAQPLSRVQTFITSWTVAHQVSLSMGFPAISSIPTRILECVVIHLSRGSSQPRDWACVSSISRRILYHWATWEASTEYAICVFLCSQETTKFYSTMKIKSIRTEVNQQGPEWMQKYKWNDMIEACINSWIYVRNSSGFPKVVAEWWDCESIGTLEWDLEVKIFSSVTPSCPTPCNPID